MSPQGTNDSDDPQPVRGNARVTTTETHISWEDFPESVREDLRESIRNDIQEQTPIEELVRKEVQRLFEEDELGLAIGEEMDDRNQEQELDVTEILALFLDARTKVDDSVVNRSHIRPGTQEESQNLERMTSTSATQRVVQIALLERPQATLYALATVMMMAAFYFSSLLVAAAGGLLLVVTALHYA